jgi:hypothetical protein
MFNVGGIITYQSDILKKQSGLQNTMAGDTILPVVTTAMKNLQQSTSTSKPYSGELLNKSLTKDSLSNIQHPLNLDSVSMTKRELIGAVGDHWTEKQKKKKNNLKQPFHLEVTTLTPQIKILQSLPLTQQQQLKNNLNNWLATFPLTSPLPNLHLLPSISCQHLLMQWPQSQQLPLSLQQLYWAELLDLEYPPTPLEVDHHLADLLEEGEIIEEESL